MNRLSILVLVLLLTACGFSPLYARHDGDGAVDALQDIKINNIADRNGQMLRNDLVDRFYTHGVPSNPRYTLNISSIEERSTDVDILPTSDATRAELRLITVMTLIDNKTEKVVLRRDLLATVSYNILRSEFTTLVSQDNVTRNGINELAEDIETQLALYFKRTPT